MKWMIIHLRCHYFIFKHPFFSMPLFFNTRYLRYHRGQSRECGAHNELLTMPSWTIPWMRCPVRIWGRSKRADWGPKARRRRRKPPRDRKSSQSLVDRTCRTNIHKTCSRWCSQRRRTLPSSWRDIPGRRSNPTPRLKTSCLRTRWMVEKGTMMRKGTRRWRKKKSLWDILWG